ncbi:MAG: phytanoyl-CoA dioxygenase family protein [Pseudomonadota bacterium]|nr:phytanoyl-CoA dioxygenase family protein [Pseudomonadota bacterium]
MQRIDVGSAVLDSDFNFDRLTDAIHAMHEDGIVCLKNAVDPQHIENLHIKLLDDLSTVATDRTKNKWNSLRPPPFHPYLYTDIVYNTFAIEVLRGVLGPNATLTTYGANTSWLGEETSQQIHRDVPDGPIAQRCPAVVLNFPMSVFCLENGPTRIYPGSHLTSVAQANGTRRYTQAMLDEQAARRAPELTTDICPGDLVIRDLRLWHGGTPNRSSVLRTMLALVVIDPDYQQTDESGFKGFEAEESAKDFWYHERLRTSVYFVPMGDRAYYLHAHHSTPPTPLFLDWQARKGT